VLVAAAGISEGTKKKKKIKKRETLFGQSDVRVSFEIGVFK
jgi:hypothetical protein